MKIDASITAICLCLCAAIVSAERPETTTDDNVQSLRDTVTALNAKVTSVTADFISMFRFSIRRLKFCPVTDILGVMEEMELKVAYHVIRVLSTNQEYYYNRTTRKRRARWI